MRENLVAHTGHECNGIIIGMVLGDSFLSRPYGNTRIQTSHKESSRDYLEWKRQLLQNYLDGDIRQVSFKSFGKDQSRLDWFSHRAKFLNYHHQDFYIQKKKIVKKSVLNRLTPLGLAIWYMDDGSLRSTSDTYPRIELATMGFDKQSLQVIVDWFAEQLGFDMRIWANGSINPEAESAWRLLALVKPYVDLVESMKYKADISRIDTSRSDSYQELPDKLKARLQGLDVSTPIKGRVWQVFSKSAMWPESDPVNDIVRTS